jgi:hypothetical protein
VDENSTMALIDFLEFFILKPFGNKEDMTKEDIKKWRQRGHTVLQQQFASQVITGGQESIDTENDDDSV